MLCNSPLRISCSEIYIICYDSSMIFTDGSTLCTFSIQVVIFRDGTYLTLREVFESLDLTGYLFCPIFNILNLFMFLYYFFCEDALHKHSSFVSTGTTWMWTFWMFMQTKAHFIVLISSIWSTTPVVKVGSGRFSLSRIILSKVYFVCWLTYYFLVKNWIRKPWLLSSYFHQVLRHFHDECGLILFFVD